MTDPATLLALADRCEQAAEADRVLDVDIAYALGWTFEKRGNEKRAWWRDRNGKKNVPPRFSVLPKASAEILRAKAATTLAVRAAAALRARAAAHD
jgi:hypothetical protein